MGAFLLVRRGGGAEPDSRLRKLCRVFRDQGWREPTVLSAAGCDIRVFPKRSGGTVAAHAIDDANFCVATGTFIYRKRTGGDALAMLHRDMARQSVAWDALYGHFCVLAAHANVLTVFVDRLGTYPVFHSAGNDVLSSRFLAVLGATASPAINRQCVYEYVFQGATYGDETVIDGIGRLDGERALVFEGGAPARETEIAPALTRPSTDGSFEERVERNVANLRSYFAAIAAAYGDRIDTALSGGYDSRLTLALLREQGVMPRLHVYGSARDEDVVVARAIAGGEKFPLEHTDKSGAPPLDEQRFAEAVAHNHYMFDGTPPDGIIDDGADIRTRMERCPEGELMLNGGGGEVFRNFFYLPDRSYSTRRFLWSFYNRFDPKLCTGLFDEDAYYGALGAKVRRAAGAAGDILTRDRIEFLYVAFRCRYWMGRNNGINNALGFALTPFIDANIVPEANATPLRYKNSGRLEGAMIRCVSPSLAGYNSAYGHNFMGAPPMRRVLKDMTTLLRPPELRRYTYRLHRRSRDAWPYFLRPSYIAVMVGDAFPYMSRFFDVDSVADREQFVRICTLEYLFRRFQPATRDC